MEAHGNGHWSDQVFIRLSAKQQYRMTMQSPGFVHVTQSERERQTRASFFNLILPTIEPKYLKISYRIAVWIEKIDNNSRGADILIEEPYRRKCLSAHAELLSGALNTDASSKLKIPPKVAAVFANCPSNLLKFSKGYSFHFKTINYD